MTQQNLRRLSDEGRYVRSLGSWHLDLTWLIDEAPTYEPVPFRWDHDGYRCAA